MYGQRSIPIVSTPAARRALGLALLFVLTTPLRAQVVSKLTAVDASSGDQFGNAVDFDGNYAIVGVRQLRQCLVWWPWCRDRNADQV